MLSLFVILVVLISCGPAFGGEKRARPLDDPAGMEQQFLDPAPEYRALPMAFDFNKPEEYRRWLAQGKWGGAHFGYPHGGPTYLQDQDGWDKFTAAVNACKENGQRVWIYDENGYPSGRAGGLTLKDHPEYEAQGLFYSTIDVVASKSPKDVEWKVPEGTPFYVAASPIGWDGAAQPDNCIDLTNKVEDHVLRTQLQPGHWRLMAFVEDRLYSGTHAQLTGGPYINIMDPDAVKRFIHITHDAFYAHCGPDFGKTITAFFNDESSVMGGYLTDETQSYPALSWYHGLPEIFQRRNGYDIRRALPALFNDAGGLTASRRCDFYSTIAATIAENYFGQIEDWCAAHNVASTGHLLWEESLLYHASFYGSMFPSLEELDWPGIDLLGCNYGCTSGARTEGGPVTPKLISSVAHLYGKKRTMSESFCFVTKKTPPEDLLAEIGWEWVLGINSLTTLSIHKEYPVETFRLLNDYTGRLSYLLTRGDFTADAAVLYPIASVWTNFVPTNRHVSFLSDNPKAKDVDDTWREVSKELLACQRDFDYIDEDTLTRARVSSGKLTFGRNRYSILVLPDVVTLRYPVLKQIESFVKSGGTVISIGSIPRHREDSGPADEFARLVDDLWSGSVRGKGRVVHVETMRSLDAALETCGTPDLAMSPHTREVYYQHRALPDGDIYFLMNNAKEAVSGRFSFRAVGKTEVWNPVDGEMKPVKSSRQGRMTSLDLTLPPRNGLFVVFKTGSGE